MNSNPVLELLTREDNPPFRLFENAASAITDSPQLLSDLARIDLQDDFLSLLISKTDSFTRLLGMINRRLTDKKRCSHHITVFIEQFAEALRDLLSESDFYDLLCAALHLCATHTDRWKSLRAITACHGALERLTVSDEGQYILVHWVSNFNQDGLEANTLEDCTRRLVKVVECCPSKHQKVPCLARWQKIERLKHAIMIALEDEKKPAQVPNKANRSEFSTEGTINDNAILQLFSELSLPIPKSSRMCTNILDMLRNRETLSVLREILESYPCGFCQYSLQHGLNLREIHQALDHDREPDSSGGSVFSASNDIGDWKVVLSSRAYRNLQAFESDHKIQESLREELRKLATGNAKSTILESSSEAPRIPLRATKWRADTYFLWQIDLAVGAEPELEQQVIKVWTVGSKKMLNSMSSEVMRYQKGFTETHVVRCLEEGPVIDGKNLPKIYDHLGNVQKVQSQAELDIRLVDQEFIDTFNKSFTLTSGLLQSIIQQDLTAEFPFDLSRTELEIIQHFKTPTLILGRSGTGKTTCLVFKMIAKYIASCKASPSQPVKQVRLIRVAFPRDFPSRFLNYHAEISQILLTRSETLAEKLRTYSKRLLSTLLPQAVAPSIRNKTEVSDKTTLLDLGHSDFPLVFTYDGFLILVANTLEALAWKTPHDRSKRSTQAKLVGIRDFQTRYWPQFPHGLTSGLSPHLVFADIMGVIKGSISTCKTLKCLTKKEYEEHSLRTAPNITTEKDRDKVFQLFELYEKLKRKAGDIDTVDWVVYLLQRLRDNLSTAALLTSCIQEVYIDEVQDQRCIDIALLFALCRDPCGYHFGGDTAQAISQDSMFRFQDIKALFYDHFSPQSTAVGQKHLAQPQIFTLNRNYRSHQGILSLASSVMDLLWRSFPDTVDKLDPEVGTLIGPTPILFLGCDATILIPQEHEAATSPEYELAFGAEQVIITRDDLGKDNVIESIGETALVLTILQAKGMEFDDVILWNFFSTTPDPSGWRSLQQCMNQDFLGFNAAKHATLCSELKNLYVAITRARVRFLMLECSNETAEPFVKLINQHAPLPLLEVTSVDAPGFSDKIKELQPRKTNDPHRWRAIGEELMGQGIYDQACVCFHRANEPLREKNARAHVKESQAEKLDAKGERRASNNAFEAAIADYQELGLISDVARLLMRLGRAEEAAKAWFDHGKYDEAALLFEKASNHQRASSSWHLFGNYDNAVTCLRNGALHDQMVLYLAQNKEFMSSQVLRQHQRVVKLLLKQEKISQELRKRAVEMVGSFTEQEAFYLEYEMTEGLLELYTAQQAKTKLFDLLVKLNRLEQALDVASSLQSRDDSTLNQGRLSKIVHIVWADRINSGLLDHSSLPLEAEAKHHWQIACSTLRTWDPSHSQRQILGMEDSSVMKAFLCLYVTIHIEKIVSASTLDKMPFNLICHTVKLLKTQQSEPRGVIGEAVLLLCGVFPGLDSLQSHTMRDWSPLRKVQAYTPDQKSLPEAAARWTFDQVSQAVIAVHERTKELFRDKWPRRCINFLTTGRCNSRSESRGCPNLHEYATSSSFADFLEDLLKVSKVLCEMSPMYYRRVMAEQTSASFLGARRYWLEKLITGLSYVSGFEQDSAVLNTVAQRIRTDECLRAVFSGLESNLLYKAREEWRSRASLGYVLEQTVFAGHLGSNVKELLIRRTRLQVRQQYPSICTAMVRFENLQTFIHHGDAVEFCNCLKDYLRGDRGIMTLEWSDFKVFHCHTSMFEAIAFYLLLQTSRTSILVPRAWLDLHLSSILNQNDLTRTPTWDQSIIYRDALVFILQAFIELLRWADTPPQAGQKFSVSGREYPSRILQQRNCEVLAIILVNLQVISNLRHVDIQKHWRAVIEVFGLDTVRARHLEHPIGNFNELRNKLFESHSRYHQKNPLLVLNVADVNPHSFTAFQKSRSLPSVSLAILRTRYASTKPSGHETTSDAEETVSEEKAALCIQHYWRKHGPKIRARNAFAETEAGRLVSKINNLGTGAGLHVRFALFHLGTACFAQLEPLALTILDVKRRAFHILKTAGPENSEALATVLETAARLEAGLKVHHERLRKEDLDPFIKAEDAQGLKARLRGELEQMAKEESEVGGLQEILAAMAKGQ